MTNRTPVLLKIDILQRCFLLVETITQKRQLIEVKMSQACICANIQQAQEILQRKEMKKIWKHLVLKVLLNTE